MEDMVARIMPASVIHTLDVEILWVSVRIDLCNCVICVGCLCLFLTVFTEWTYTDQGRREAPSAASTRQLFHRQSCVLRSRSQPHLSRLQHRTPWASGDTRRPRWDDAFKLLNYYFILRLERSCSVFSYPLYSSMEFRNFFPNGNVRQSFKVR